MNASEPVSVPLLNRKGEIVTYAIVDPDDLRYVSTYTWRLHHSGYAVAKACTVLMHRLILGLDKGDPRKADHINRNKLDNRRSNLRIVESQAANLQNVPARGGSSRHRGVSFFKPTSRWRAQCQIDGHTRHIGYFATEEEAAVAARAFRREHMPYAVD